MKLSSIFLIALLVAPGLADGKAKKVDDYHWTGVDRIIAIGDLHGDYDQYFKVMRSAGLIDKKGKWSGGETHFVQTGDITDRGAGSRKIIDHLLKLAKQAKKKGGYVHLLIGNHESMNVIGDLRYVHPGEYRAFSSRNSARYQDMQWENQLNWMRNNDLEAFAELDLDVYRKEWEQRVPLGWVEHRQAWALSGEYGGWVKDNAVAIQVNDSLFLHGGLSAKYCKFSLESLTQQVIEAMQNYDPALRTILDDADGPLWYRGLAQEEEQTVFSLTLDNILERYGARRIVVGHTPTGGVVWPRFDGRVVVNDTGIAAHYGAHKGVLELTVDGAVAIYGEQRIPLPVTNEEREDYLRAVIAADSNNKQLKDRLARMLAPPVEAADVESGQGADAADGEVVQVQAMDAALESIPGTCQ